MSVLNSRAEVVSVAAVAAWHVSHCQFSRNHEVPSLPMAQLRPLLLGRLINRLVTTAVFGVDVLLINVTVFVAPTAHEPENVPIRKTPPPLLGVSTRRNRSGARAQS